MCRLGFQWFNREILHGLSNFGQGEEQGTCVQLHPEKFILCCKAKHQMWFATFGLDYPRSSVKGPFCGWCLGAKHGSFSDGNGWLGRNVTLVNYDNWAIRITKANINLGGLWVCQLCELQMYALMNTLLHHQRQNFLMHATLVEMTFIIRAHAYYIHGPSSDSQFIVCSKWSQRPNLLGSLASSIQIRRAPSPNLCRPIALSDFRFEDWSHSSWYQWWRLFSGWKNNWLTGPSLHQNSL